VLDPFVRLHRVDENAAAEVAPLLAYLRQLERRFRTAVLLVHHSRKGAAHARAGQALRGSSELHAWGDSNLYLKRKGDALLLTVEHRAAPSPADLALELLPRGEALALHVLDVAREHLEQSADDPSPRERIERASTGENKRITKRISGLRAASGPDDGRLRGRRKSRVGRGLYGAGEEIRTLTPVNGN